MVASGIQTVSQITQAITRALETDFSFVHITGEVSNLRVPYSGHSYFVLKDQQAQLKCVLFKGQKRYLDKTLQDGQQIICHGRISVYSQRGDYQLIVDTIDFSGLGNLQLEFDKLKEKLAKEGLFAEERKRGITTHPKKVIIITSPSGAAIQDFLKVYQSKKSPCDLLILPSSVQGTAAPAELIRALDMANTSFDADAIVLCRGGGSMEDLWAFNDEGLARSINRSAIPVISAVGHEIDFTIADFCADVRCPTPTGAAEFLFTESQQILSTIDNLTNRLTACMHSKLFTLSEKLDYNRKLLGDLNGMFQHLELSVDFLTNKLINSYQSQFYTKESKFFSLQTKYFHLSPYKQLQSHQQKTLFLQQKLFITMRHLIAQHQARLAKLAAVLDSVSPLSTLARGYSIVQKKREDGRLQVIRDSGELQQKDRLLITFKKGKISCTIDQLEQEN